MRLIRLAIRIFPLLLLTGGVCAAPPRVAVDVGHDLIDSGASSARERPEFEFNRALAGRLAHALRTRGLEVLEINFDGNVINLADRTAQAAGSDFFISIHHDSIAQEHLQTWEWNGAVASHTEAKRGHGLFISALNPAPETSLRCAGRIGARLRDTGFVPTPWHGRKHAAADADNGIWYFDNLLVLYQTSLPAVLFEAGVIKHRDEELELLDPLRQVRMAEALADGIADCLPAGRD